MSQEQGEETTEVPVRFLRNSERKTYRTCRLMWDWKYNRGLVTPRPRGVLTFGTGVHYALEMRYPPGVERGPHPAITFETWYKENEHHFHTWDDEGNRHEALELGIAMLNAYVDRYGTDDHIKIIAPEMAMSIDIADKNGNYLCTWVGTTDAAYEDLSRSNKKRKRIGFFEHKTAKTIEHNLRLNSGYGDQGLSYAWAGSLFLQKEGIIGPNDNIDHILFNWLRKGLPDMRPVDHNGYSLNKPGKDALLSYSSQHGIPLPKKPKVEDIMNAIQATGFDPLLLGEPSKTQPSPILERAEIDYGDGEMEMTGWRIRAEAWEMAQVRAGKLPIYKSPSKDCSWQCEFVDACELHEMGSDYESVLELEFDKWNPYEDHEDKNEEKE